MYCTSEITGRFQSTRNWLLVWAKAFGACSVSSYQTQPIWNVYATRTAGLVSETGLRYLSKWKNRSYDKQYYSNYGDEITQNRGIFPTTQQRSYLCYVLCYEVFCYGEGGFNIDSKKRNSLLVDV
jgi:hypothetical protein